MAARPVKVAFLADTADLRANLKKAEDSMDSAAAQARTAGERIDASFDSTAESADAVASKGAQAAGALSGLGDLVGGKFGAAMMTGGIAMQAFADAGDLINVVTESNIVRKIKDTAVTAAQTTATYAKAAADKVAAGAAKVWAVAQTALNAVLAGNPIALMVIALVAVGAALVIAYKKSEKFRAIVNGAFNAVKAVVGAVLPAIKATVVTVFEGIKAFLSGSLKVLKAIFSGAWNAIKAVTKGAFIGVKTLVVQPIEAVVDFIRGVPGKIKALGGKFLDAGRSIMSKIVDGIKSAAGFIGNIASGIWNAVKGMLNQAIDKINSALEFRISLPLGKSITINPPDIPHLAKGGIVSSPTLALIGEAGPEAVVPLGRGGGVGGDTYITVNVTAPVGSNAADIGRGLQAYLDAYYRSGGRRKAL